MEKVCYEMIQICTVSYLIFGRNAYFLAPPQVPKYEIFINQGFLLFRKIDFILFDIIVSDKRICVPVLMPMVELAARRSQPQKTDAEGEKTQMLMQKNCFAAFQNHPIFSLCMPTRFPSTAYEDEILSSELHSTLRLV